MIGSYTYKQGFTLIELMISIVLGLLVSAAGLQMLLSSQRSMLIQEAGSSIQDNAGFGLQAINRSLRSANIGALGVSSGSVADSEFIVRSDNPFAGIVITTDDDKAFDANSQNLESILSKPSATATATDPVNVNYLTCTDGLSSVTKVKNICKTADTSNNRWSGASNLGDEKSDQLVVMYKAPMNGGFDCEGNAVARGTYVVERFFLRKDTISQPGEPTPLALVCDAGQMQYDSDKYQNNTLDLVGLGGAGEVLLTRVDHFKFQVGVTRLPAGQTNTAKNPQQNQIAYYDLDEYLEDHSDERITHIRYAVLMRSISPANSALPDKDQEFTMLNKDGLKLDSPGNTRYMRKVFTTSVLLRSGRG